MVTVKSCKSRLFLTLLMSVLCLLASYPDRSVQAQDATFDSPSLLDIIREPAIAGSWYPASAPELSRQIEDFLNRVPPTDIPGQITTLIAPHAGYTYSGQVAAYAYKILEKHKFSTVIVIAPSHHAAFSGVAVYDQGGFRTPLGVVPLDQELISVLEERDSRISYVPEVHTKEHAVEIQLPFLQTLMPGFKLVPLVMGEQDLLTCQWLAEALADSVRGKQVLIVASSDLSHFHPYEEAKVLDQIVIDRVNAFDPQGLSGSLAQGRCEACGGGPIVTAMLAARLQGATTGQVMNYANSGDVTGDRSKVVGYLAAAFWIGPTPKPVAQAVPQKKAGIDLGLNREEKAILHKIVKETIEAQCRGAKMPKLDVTSPTLKESRGAFVTLHKRGELRGCIGHIVTDRPLAETITEMAAAAAFHDPRFPAVTADELKDLDYEISVLTPLRQIKDVSEIQVGIHGILIKKDGRSGLLLPQVATEYRWDRATFLEQTCRKALLPKDAWKDSTTEIYIFSADVF